MKEFKLLLIIIQILLTVFYTYKIAVGTIATFDAVMMGVNITSMYYNLLSLLD